MTEEQERAAFENWYTDEGTHPRATERSGGGYKYAPAHIAWGVWKARAALSQPASVRQIADEYANSGMTSDEFVERVFAALEAQPASPVLEAMTVEQIWGKVEAYADAVCEYNTAVRIDVGIDAKGKECLAIEKDLRAALMNLNRDAGAAPNEDASHLKKA